MMCVNMWCIYSVKPTWRHGTASALTSLISIWLRGEGHLCRAESVLQNCVMGRCAICIFMYCYISLFTMKKFWTRFKKFGILAVLLTYIRPELREWTEWQCLGGFVTQCWQKFRKNVINNINIHKVCSTRSWNVWNIVQQQKYGLISAYVDVSRDGT